MKINELGVIRYGELRFKFFATSGVVSYFENKGISSDSLLVSSQAFYRAVCYKLDLDHGEKKDVEVVFYGISLDQEGVDNYVSGYMDFDSFPLEISGRTFFVNFGARVE